MNPDIISIGRDLDGKVGDLVCEAECGAAWLMDYEPSPDWCSCEFWRLGIIGEGWGSWVDSEGRERGE